MTYGVINYGGGWRKDVVNQCLEFGPETDSSALNKSKERSNSVY